MTNTLHAISTGLASGPFALLVKLATAGALLTSLAACETYAARRDTISSNAGDAVRSNIALHTEDFWPRQSFDPNIPMRGARAVANTRAYDARTVGAPTAEAMPREGSR